MKSAITRFRVMAIICGVMSLLLWFVYMPGKYVFHVTEDHKVLVLIPMVHGYLFMVYLLTVLQLAIQKRWNLFRMLWTMFAGTIPVASFLAERRVAKSQN